MLDKEAQQALVALMETKRNLEEQVLRVMRDPDMTTKHIVKLRGKYLEFLESLQEIEERLEAHQQGTEEDWLAMWKGQTND
jgi:predicted  nucleic acid-binding Zn-ribbon protein